MSSCLYTQLMRLLSVQAATELLLNLQSYQLRLMVMTRVMLVPCVYQKSLTLARCKLRYSKSKIKEVHVKH